MTQASIYAVSSLSRIYGFHDGEPYMFNNYKVAILTSINDDDTKHNKYGPPTVRAGITVGARHQTAASALRNVSVPRQIITRMGEPRCPGLRRARAPCFTSHVRRGRNNTKVYDKTKDININKGQCGYGQKHTIKIILNEETEKYW